MPQPACSAVAGGRLRCTHLPAELADLPALEFLDLKCNALNSSVPAEWRAAGRFPVLQTLNLGERCRLWVPVQPTAALVPAAGPLACRPARCAAAAAARRPCCLPGLPNPAWPSHADSDLPLQPTTC